MSDAGGRVAGSPFSSGSNVVSSGPPTAYPGGFGGPTPIGRGPGGGSVPYAALRRRSVNPALFVIAGFFLALSGILGLGVLAAEVWFFTTPDGQQALETATEQASTDPRVNREQMKEADVEQIIQKAKECHPGVTPRIISDNGPQFIAKDFKEFIRISGMTHVRTSPYYPQSNGKLERWNKSIKSECIRPGVPLSLEDANRLIGQYVTQIGRAHV